MNYLERKKLIIGLHRQKHTYRQIGKFFGISAVRVGQIITGKPDYRSKHSIVDSKMLQPNGVADLTVKNPIGSGQRDRVREYVRIRDNRTCQSCGKQWKEGDRRFDVHHIDEEQEGENIYKKGRCKWDKEHTDRMITFCHKCHLNLDINRKKFGKYRVDNPSCADRPER